MRTRDPRLLVLAAAVAAAALSGSPLTAQAPAGQGYTPPSTAAGHPDLQGVWRAWNLAKYDLEAHGAKPGVPAGLGFVVDPADGKIPVPAGGAQAPRRELRRHQGSRSLEERRPAGEVLPAGRAAHHLHRVAVPDHPDRRRRDPQLRVEPQEAADPGHEGTAAARRRRTSTTGTGFRAGAGKGTRWSSTTPTSTATPGSTWPATTAAPRSR